MSGALATVFVDRDGVINKKRPDGEYVNAVDEFELVEGSVDALAEFSSRGFIVVIVTNQQGIAKGVTPPHVVDEIHQRLRVLVAEAGGEISQIRVCPHREDTCDCRKPASGLFEQARQADPRIRFCDSTVIGDSLSDIDAARRIGARAIFVGEAPLDSPSADVPMTTAPDLAATLDLLPWGQMTSEEPGGLRLNLGCNADVRPGWVNVDIADYGGNEIIDLNSYPWPFEQNSVAEVSASHVLEHLDNFNSVVTELWRVCQPGALIEVAVPFFLSTKFYSEPDHRIPFGIRSFDNYEFIGDRKLRFYEQWKLKWRTNYESDAQFTIESKRFHFSNFKVLSWLDHVINLEPVVFERFFATLLTPEEVHFRLRVVGKPVDQPSD